MVEAWRSKDSSFACPSAIDILRASQPVAGSRAATLFAVICCWTGIGGGLSEGIEPVSLRAVGFIEPEAYAAKLRTKRGDLNPASAFDNVASQAFPYESATGC